MKIVLATPLFPPDTAKAALYAKEVARRLAKAHSVTVVTYGEIPEKVPGVAMIMISKKRPLFIRLLTYTAVLFHSVRNADAIFALNGASVELPVTLVSILLRKPVCMQISDTAAHLFAQKERVRRWIEESMVQRARVVSRELPLERPEILPFGEKHIAETAVYEASWANHMKKLQAAFTYVS